MGENNKTKQKQEVQTFIEQISPADGKTKFTQDLNVNSFILIGWHAKCDEAALTNGDTLFFSNRC